MEGGYQFSRYNNQFCRNGRHYLWNTLSNAFLELDEDDIQYLEQEGSPDTQSPLFKPLYNNGCIVRESFDELGKVLFEEKAVMTAFDPETLQFTIAPGFGCNYDCVYCFEHHRSAAKHMSSDTKNAVCRFIINATERHASLKSIRITWFGGEPLLYKSDIADISYRLMEYCGTRNIRYDAGIVTNGRFLDPDTALMLKALNIRYVQLSFDGTRKVYMKQKKASSSDYYITIQNICNCADLLPITIRINIWDDPSDAIDLTDYFLNEQNLDGKIKMYVAHIRDYTRDDAASERFSHERFLEAQGRYMQLFGENGKFNSKSFCYISPKRRYTTCATVCRYNCCIGPDGELYRCEHYFGDVKKVIGTVFDGYFNNEQDLRYLFFQHPDVCKACSMFPICLGGCMNDAMNGEISLSCEALKNRWIDMLMLYHQTEKGGTV